MTREEAIIQLRLGPGINEDVSEEYNDAVNIAIEALEAMDNAQNTLQHVGSVERTKGHWLISNPTPTGNYRLRCDQCGKKYLLEWGKDLDDYKLCPNCGADMRGENDETD